MEFLGGVVVFLVVVDVNFGVGGYEYMYVLCFVFIVICLNISMFDV